MTTLSRTPILLLATAAFLCGRAAQACVMCGSSFGENDPTTGAFASSVLFLIAAPYTVFFAAAGCLYLLYRRGAAGRRARVVPIARRRAQPTDRPKEVTP